MKRRFLGLVTRNQIASQNINPKINSWFREVRNFAIDVLLISADVSGNETNEQELAIVERETIIKQESEI